MEKKPQVFGSSKMTEAMLEANETGTRIAKQVNEELNIGKTNRSEVELSVETKMKKDSLDKLEEQLRLRDELMTKKKRESSGEYQEPNDMLKETPEVTYANVEPTKTKKIKLSEEDKIEQLSRPQLDVPYDVIKLPSDGLLYKNHSGTIKIAYLNAMDENIITNPNLLRSGKFLEVLINRKLIEGNLKYNDLHVGDRNAIMVWLRSTGYGSMYNIVLNNPNDEYKEFSTKIDLSKLPIKPLGDKPDENGHFTLYLDLCGKTVKFRLLTIGDVDDIDEHIENMIEEYGDEFTDASTYTLKKQIVAVDGDYDKEFVNNFVDKGMRLGDVRAFRKHIDKIESGLDMNITVRTPGGESINTFLPLNTSFFWPDFEL